MISIVITSFNEPATIKKAIDSFLQQDLPNPYELIVVAPDEKTHEIVRNYFKKYKNVKLFIDPGKGKSYALNLLLPNLNGDIIILSDGDVYVSQNSVREMLKFFREDSVGCVSGRVVSINSRTNLFGYWSHLLCDAAHWLRIKRHKKNNFLECSGYLWAFRNNVIKKFPLDVGEDTIVPIMFWKKGYKIKYASRAEVYVKFPSNLNDFLKQKRRAAGAHDNIRKYISLKKIPRMKTFWNEVSGGARVFFSAETFKEFLWTIFLFPFRLYIWANLFYNSKIWGRKYVDGWKRVESSK